MEQLAYNIIWKLLTKLNLWYETNQLIERSIIINGNTIERVNLLNISDTDLATKSITPNIWRKDLKWHNKCKQNNCRKRFQSIQFYAIDERAKFNWARFFWIALEFFWNGLDFKFSLIKKNLARFRKKSSPIQQMLEWGLGVGPKFPRHFLIYNFEGSLKTLLQYY